MSRHIDVDALGIGKADRNAFTIPEYADGWNSAIEIIANAPTADVVEVVRCKDCRWWEWEYAGGTVGRCQNPRNGLVYELTDDTDYCSYGERSENGT